MFAGNVITLAAFANLASLQPIDGLAFLGHGQHSTRGKKNAVWVQGFPRSGSSTILSMLTVGHGLTGNSSDAAGERLFSLFEPCHPGDEVELDSGERALPWGTFPNVGFLSKESAPKSGACEAMLKDMMSCDFRKIAKLWGWSNHHSSNYGIAYAPQTASELCEKADTVVLKTVGKGKIEDPGRLLANALWLLEAQQNLHIFEVVRDPRAIFASWKNTEPFPRILKERQQGGWAPIWKEACDAFSANLDVSHPRVHRVVFEELVQRPEATMRAALAAIGGSFGKDEMQWISSTLDADKCARSEWGHYNYSDCQVDPIRSLNKWQQELAPQELKQVSDYGPCRRVFAAYNYSF